MMSDGSKLAESLSAKFGLTLVADNGASVNAISLRVADIEPPNGFAVHVVSAWRSIEARFSPDPFASQLIKSICSSTEEQRRNCSNIVAGFFATGIRSRFQIDGNRIDSGDMPAGEWKQFALTCSRLTAHEAIEKDAEDVGMACLSIILSLLSFEPGQAEAAQASGEQEGSVSRHEVTRYERSPANRAAAIAFHGTRCEVCDFDFRKVYGTIGDGYIEIHHITPVSQLGGPIVIDPRVDLVPLCSNCHRMVHRQNPPIAIQELRTILAHNRQTSSPSQVF